MGFLDFAANIGKKLFDREDEGSTKIKQYIEKDNPGVDDLQVAVNDGVAKLSGTAKSREAFEKAVLMAGNVKGIEEVNVDELKAPDEEGEVQFYEIQSGDTLWKIAQEYYGHGSKYTVIFQANREVIKDADLIYPGQKIRIPK